MLLLVHRDSPVVSHSILKHWYTAPWAVSSHLGEDNSLSYNIYTQISEKKEIKTENWLLKLLLVHYLQILCYLWKFQKNENKYFFKNCSKWRSYLENN